MFTSTKKLLKQLDVLFISERDDYYIRVKNILDIFFKKTHTTNSRINAKNLYSKTFPSLIVIDINLKEGNGIEFIKSIREKNKTITILVITKNKQLENLLEAIKLNLVDYLIKPFNINKLIYTLNICAKQILNSGDVKSHIKNNINYDYLKRTAITNNETIALTKKEAILLELFLVNKNKYINNDEIKTHIWSHKEVADSTFKSLIKRLSAKIGKDTISNSFGVGYGIFDD